MLWRLKQRQLAWLAEERGTIRKDWADRLCIALAFPNRYRVGMSNLGFQAVYRALNRFEEIVCERVFYPEPEDVDLIRQNPGHLLSVESQRPLQDFHLIAFSIAYENDYAFVLEMLAFGGIPPRAQDRTAAHPLVTAGGVAVFLNPEPLAPFIDCFFIGEAEELLPDFRKVLQPLLREGPARPQLLEALAVSMQGIYVPSLYQVSYRSEGTIESMTPVPWADVPKRIKYRRADLLRHPPCQTQVVTPNTEFSDTVLLEIGRGCGRGCRFCAAGFVYRPVRFHSARAVLDATDKRGPAAGRLGLVSAAVSDHPEISALCETLSCRGVSVSFSSLRADSIPPAVVASLRSSGHQAVAIAPEAGSERLRRVINKNLSESQILEAAERLAEGGILHLKLYFMIGLPTETQEDLEAIVHLAKSIKHHVLKMSRGKKRMGTITLSVNSFVPKPFTPFQWVPFAGISVLKEKARWIHRGLQKVPNVRVHFDLPKWAYVQALLARGDRRVAGFLEKVALGGASWQQALREIPFNPDFWVLRERGEDEVFPWEFIDNGIERRFLWEEYQSALQESSTPPCRPDEKCVRCGVCREQRERSLGMVGGTKPDRP